MGMVEYVNVVINIIDILTLMKTCVQSGVNTVTVLSLCKVKKMKNPCTECLVQPACSHVCPDKVNYGTILKHAHEIHRDYFFQNPKVARIKEMYKYYKNKQRQHLSEMVLIDTKRRNIGRSE